MANAKPKDFAKLMFSDEGPELEKALGTYDEWVQQAPNDFALLRLAVAVLRKNDAEMLAVVQNAGPELPMELADAWFNLEKRYRAQAEALQAARIRTFAGLSRHSQPTDGC